MSILASSLPTINGKRPKVSKTYRHIPHWAAREPRTRKEFMVTLGTDGANYGSTHMASSHCPNGYDKYEIIGAASAAFNKRRASHINRRRGKAEVAKLLLEAQTDLELDQEYLQEITESDLDIDWTYELDEWLDEHDYKFDPNRDEPQYDDWAYEYRYE